MTDRVWHEGPPPHVGWWLTQDDVPTGQNEWRWWNGMYWSTFCFEDEDGSDGNHASGLTMDNLIDIRWCDYWPENARVPRLDPTAGDWTFHHGGRAPVIGLGKGRVQIAMRSGSTYTMPASQARQHRWVHQGNFGDIVGWRRIGKSMAQKGHHEHR